jgi:hypothetical protein
MINDTIVYFLEDFLDLLCERAEEAKKACKQLGANKDTPGMNSLECGRALAYYEVLSSFINQAKVFGIDDLIPELNGIDPEQLLA